MHKLTGFVLILGLSACVTSKPAPTAAFRVAGAPMWSNAQLETPRLVGRWREAAGFAPQGATCRPGGAEITPAPGGALRIAARLCLAGVSEPVSGIMQPTGPGRFRVAGQEWWVIWADTDYRTLAIATPSGRFGFVLDRSAGLSADRARAAREVFEFNGYAPAAFVRY